MTAPTPAGQHTTVIATDFEPRIIVQEEDGRWFRVLNWFYDEIVPTLSVAPLKLMLGMLRHRDNATGLVSRTRKQFEAELRLSKQAVSDGIIHLKAHPCRLLVEHGPTSFEPMPGRFLAQRGSPPSRTPVRPGGQKSAPADSVSIERARARPPRLVKTETQNQTQPEEMRADPAGWSGSRPPADAARRWPELSLWGQMAEARGDMRGVLEDLGIRPPTLELVAAIPGLSIARILATAAAVADDQQARNKAACLAGRLLGRRLPTGVEARARGRLDKAELSAVVELERLRLTRTRSHSPIQEPAR